MTLNWHRKKVWRNDTSEDSSMRQYENMDYNENMGLLMNLMRKYDSKTDTAKLCDPRTRQNGQNL